MNKKILISILLFANNANFCMEGDATLIGETPDQPVPSLSPQLNALAQNQAQKELVEAYKKPIDKLLPENNEVTSEATIPEPAPLERNKADRKRVTILSIASSVAYINAPKQIQQMCDQVEEHPKVAVLTALSVGEACGLCCCPNLTYALNLLGIGWFGRTAYDEFMKKEKDE